MHAIAEIRPIAYQAKANGINVIIMIDKRSYYLKHARVPITPIKNPRSNAVHIMSGRYD